MRQNNIKKIKFDIDNFLATIYELDLQNKQDVALDIILDAYYNLYANFDTMNDVLYKIDVSRLSPAVLVCFMCQTFKYIDQVSNHIEFCNRCEIRMRDLFVPEQDIRSLVDRYKIKGNY